jgi:hypothetical protein
MRGRATGYLGTNIRRWLGDPRPDVEMFREALTGALGTDARNMEEPEVRIFVAALASGANDAHAGITLTPRGRREYLAFLIGK